MGAVTWRIVHEHEHTVVDAFRSKKSSSAVITMCKQPNNSAVKS